MYLLDINVISELRHPRPHGTVLAWLQNVPDSDLHLSAVTTGEPQAGVEITHDQDPIKANRIFKAVPDYPHASAKPVIPSIARDLSSHRRSKILRLRFRMTVFSASGDEQTYQGNQEAVW